MMEKKRNKNLLRFENIWCVCVAIFATRYYYHCNGFFALITSTRLHRTILYEAFVHARHSVCVCDCNMLLFANSGITWQSHWKITWAHCKYAAFIPNQSQQRWQILQFVIANNPIAEVIAVMLPWSWESEITPRDRF